MKPQPLDLDGVVDKVLDIVTSRRQIELVVNEVEVIKTTKKVIKQRLKSACEFYLRYKDNPDLLMKEQPEYEKETKKFYSKGRKTKHRDIIGMWHLDEYNEWLFRLAFKGVME